MSVQPLPGVVVEAGRARAAAASAQQQPSVSVAGDDCFAQPDVAELTIELATRRSRGPAAAGERFAVNPAISAPAQVEGVSVGDSTDVSDADDRPLRSGASPCWTTLAQRAR